MADPRSRPTVVVRDVSPSTDCSTIVSRSHLQVLLARSPIPPEVLLDNLALYMPRTAIVDAIAMGDLYRRILCVPGTVMEFGTRWGRRLPLFVALRELYEPYDYTRRIVGFDTFSGFPRVHVNDGGHPEIHAGSMSTATGYAEHLSRVLEAHEEQTALPHIRRVEVRAGDVVDTVPDYLRDYPETLVSLAYFDLDLYEPTRACMSAIRSRLVPGSILAFDELAHHNFPGETLAVLDELGLRWGAVEKLPHHRGPTIVTVATPPSRPTCRAEHERSV
ncbi:hypothetical protein SAMN06893096_102175 [Geodermatophilus pulveris]|uniref:Macrocin-O-methyltransferase (TylF) n=1 Tax=Geodermatophilus pulveris TaxID=1564159 RepID=A0A239C084_9ACTN|nr:hypothetical protein [Geodermatophilus pulveris]SNS13566.1 hypothetical protein SAMN06893096_102175 [Geodermatophilus pulveris]